MPYNEKNHSLTIKRVTKMSALIRILIAIPLSPLAVFLTVGLGGAFWINLILYFLGVFPGTIHAIWVIAKHDD